MTTPVSKLSADELSAFYTKEMNRVEGSHTDYRCWFYRGWYRTSKGNAYRRPDIERFVERLASKPDFDPNAVEEPEESSSVFKR